LKSVLIFYSHFSPAFKAGGPIQSLVNLVEVLRSEFSVFVVCGARDMGEHTLLDGIRPNAWNKLNENVNVFYIDGSVYKAVRSAFNDTNPDIVYINGLFLPGYDWLPLLFAKRRNRKVIMAPRGMLQKGALSIRPAKKFLFLWFFKLLGLHKNIIWHATDTEEGEDTKRIFGNNAITVIVANIPKPPRPAILQRSKAKGKLRMVYLSLITEKKNLHLVLMALKIIETPVQFDIYGPIKDTAYWKKCEHLMEDQVHAIRYLGALYPARVQDVLSDYHLFILPTKGENFGHAIYEALSSGTPVLVSPFTPWGKLQDSGAGLTTQIDIDSLVGAIKTFIQYDEQEFSQLSFNAHKLASSYFFDYDFRDQYRKLFS
jgi:glycosyltransferase involved in cell wall biosynthesis